MSESEEERIRLLIKICTISLSQMIGGAVIGQPHHIEDGRKSLEKALCTLMGLTEDVKGIATTT